MFQLKQQWLDETSLFVHLRNHDIPQSAVLSLLSTQLQVVLED